MILLKTVIYCHLIFIGVNPLDLTQLAHLGTVPTAIRSLVYYTYGRPAYITVDLLPKIQGLDQSCEYPSLQRYNQTVTSLIQPLAENIERILVPPVVTGVQARFFGAIIGTLALGVATAAQITAAIGLSKAQANAKSILSLKNALSETNQAVSSLVKSGKILAHMISAIQDQVNNVIQPALRNLTCQVKDLQLASILNLYLTELTTVFHNQITNPALEPLSIQALRSLLGSTLPQVLQTLDTNDLTAASIMASGLIQGQVVAVDLQHSVMVIMIKVPSVSPLANAKVIDLVSITMHSQGRELQAVFPKRLLELGSEILGFNGGDCQLTRDLIFCPYNDAYILSPNQKMCLQGSTESCILTPILGSYPRRFVTYQGTIIANCRDTVCSCMRPPKVIYQPDEAPVTIIDQSVCSKLSLDSITIEVQTMLNSTFSREIHLSESQIISLSPLDLANDLGRFSDTIKDAEAHITKSEQIISSINPGIINDYTIIILIVALLILIILAVIVFFWLKLLTRELKSIRRELNSSYSHILMHQMPAKLPTRQID
uniref:Fusion glycoprotein F0 n=1 Tax=Eptesicus fuscus orthorubulavirus TaxID=2884705 RepID=A0A8K1JZG4_9MONO|nr:F [Eptesicus fuscus orthorubulavirus] [Eptesicus fuscus orthorubulavirus]